MIASCRQQFPIRMMCRLLRVSPSGYYARQTRPKSRRATSNAELAQAIRRIHTESGEVYGSPKVWQELQGRGQACGQHRVARLMKLEGLHGIPSKKRWRTRKAGTCPEGVTNHLARDFAAAQLNTKWVTDITYIRTAEGWLYLAIVLDLCSRQVIGWAMQPQQDCDLVIQAVQMAVGQRRSSEDLVLHSDRGTQYTGQKFQAFLNTQGVVSSMSGVGNCYDNAVAESFFGLLKRERVHRRHYLTRAEAKTDIFDYIERFYNRQRQHSYVKGLSPAAYAKQVSETLN